MQITLFTTLFLAAGSALAQDVVDSTDVVQQQTSETVVDPAATVQVDTATGEVIADAPAAATVDETTAVAAAGGREAEEQEAIAAPLVEKRQREDTEETTTEESSSSRNSEESSSSAARVQAEDTEETSSSSGRVVEERQNREEEAEEDFAEKDNAIQKRQNREGAEEEEQSEEAEEETTTSGRRVFQIRGRQVYRRQAEYETGNGTEVVLADSTATAVVYVAPTASAGLGAVGFVGVSGAKQVVVAGGVGSIVGALMLWGLL
ncbi:hypothetical protein QBC38DRAFT_494387 [Podospora fimiseda]|uniref:Uncharacterized protein n=1 Tax=Podospora fimiseda TaxID=252190 RepID=A0AAN6YQC3_9PEZI|nr:hypothetical protein QBC38DRAFT_494387 [Podospora fimiseda]